MTMTPVSSSNLSSVGYDQLTHRLYIRFVSGGLYEYSDVPIDTYNELMNASSKGKYHAAYIKYSFPYRRIG